MTYDKIMEARCTECLTPLCLPHELEGIARPIAAGAGVNAGRKTKGG